MIHLLKNISRSFFLLQLTSIYFFALSACVTARKEKQTSTHYPTAPVYEKQIIDDNKANSFATSWLIPDNLNALTPDARMIYQIKNYYQQRDYENALESTKKFEAAFPSSPYLTQTYVFRALIYQYKNYYLQSSYYFKRALQKNSDSKIASFLNYYLALTEFKSQQYEEAFDSLSKINIAELDGRTKLKTYTLMGQIFLDQKEWLTAAESLLASGQKLDEFDSKNQAFVQYRSQMASLLEEALSEIKNSSQLEALKSKFKNSFFIDHVLYHLAQIQKINGYRDKAEQALNEILYEHPHSMFTVEAHDEIGILKHDTIVNKKSVGILLPLSGKFEPIGRKCLQGIQLAFRIFDKEKKDSNVQLIIEDSGETPEQTLSALDRLYFNHHVIAVLGPLLSRNADATSKRANELGLPLLLLTQSQGIPGPYNFHASITPDDQAQEIAHYAITVEGMKKFAILHPATKFGENYYNAFWDTVKKLGGEIVGIESYPEGETDFKSQISKLVGLYYKDARQDELDALEQEREKLNVTHKTRMTRQYFDLPPILDFDAVFIPDDAKTVGLIIPTFAFKDVENVKFLGISTWNSPELIERAKKNAENSLFVLAYNPNTHSAITSRFVHQFQDTFHEIPGPIEAIAYDAAAILDKALFVAGDPKTRAELKDSLMNTQQFPGVTGQISYTDNKFKRTLKVFTVRDNQFVEAYLVHEIH